MGVGVGVCMYLDVVWMWDVGVFEVCGGCHCGISSCRVQVLSTGYVAALPCRLSVTVVH